MKISKRMKSLNKEKIYDESLTIENSIAKLLELSKKYPVKFIESIDISFKLGINTKKSDQTVKGFVELPHGNGKEVKILVIADDENIEKAKAAGAKYVGGDELIDQIIVGTISDFDKCICTPSMMPKLAKAARILGPKGLMPNPKLGTVTPNVVPVITSFLKGRIEIKADKEGYLKLSIGKINFEIQKLKENLLATYNAVKTLKPSSIKSGFFKELKISTTMGVAKGINMTELYNN